MLRYAAEKQLAYSPASMRAQHDEIAAFLRDVRDDAPCHISFRHLVSMYLDGDFLGAQTVREAGQVQVCLVLGLEVSLPMNGGRGTALQDMQQNDSAAGK